MLRIISFIAITVLFTSCAAMFMPKKQKVTFTTKNNESKVYLDKEETGKGTLFTSKIAKGSTRQITVRTPGYKDNYSVLIPSRRPGAYWFLFPLNVLNVFCFASIDVISPKNMAYQKVVDLPLEGKLVYRGEKDKYVDILSIKLNIKNKDKDMKNYLVYYSPTNLEDNIKKSEQETNARDAQEEARLAKKKSKKGQLVEPEDKEIKYDDTKFSYNVYRTLKTTGFVDTVNKFFSDFNNSIYLEGSIDKINTYTVKGSLYNYFNKCKVSLTWYIKNNFGEILDSIVTSEYSGDFVYNYSYSIYSSADEIARIKSEYQDKVGKMFGDAIDKSYLNLHKNPTFTKYLAAENNFSIKDPGLTIPVAKAYVTDKTDASSASVIVKTKDGHGSGFAISQDGYILTNYHVIAGRINNKLNSVKIINSAGEESEGTIVRYNKYRDLALIKVDKKFEKPFKVTNVKSFKNMSDVLTIGAPKSVELGQSVSTGVISNERKANNNNLIQLNMAINSGNSGGPLFDATGTLHGVIVSKAIGKNTEGISFAIPGYLIQEYLNLNFK